MANVTIEISDADFALFKEDEKYLRDLLKQTLAEALQGIKTERSVWVKAMTRLKTPVVNWNDLEEQILKGSVG